MNNSGYTLVELLVAVVILSIALLGIISAICAAQDTQSRAINNAIAHDIIVSQIENYRLLAGNSIAEISGTSSYTSTNLPRGNSITTTISQQDGSTRLWRTTVVVAWPEGNSSHSITYDTIFYKP